MYTHTYINTYIHIHTYTYINTYTYITYTQSTHKKTQRETKREREWGGRGEGVRGREIAPAPADVDMTVLEEEDDDPPPYQKIKKFISQNPSTCTM
jgi:hypothetical protein